MFDDAILAKRHKVTEKLAAKGKLGAKIFAAMS
jgi:hypothetical protein